MKVEELWRSFVYIEGNEISSIYLKNQLARESFAFGGVELQDFRYFITENCNGCGLCVEKCPQNCIEVGNPYKIIQEHCLHCGNCMEVCPENAVLKKV